MVEYCLPKKYASVFMNALKDGTIVPSKLVDMTSAERNAFFLSIVGEEHAAEVNALFEAKLLLKNQKEGLANWAQKLSGITEPVRKDIVDKINKLDKVLQPAEERSFLADLAAMKLGIRVTTDEAREIFRLSQVAAAAKVKMLRDVDNEANRIAYGRALMDVTDYATSLKPRLQTAKDIVLNIAGIPKSLLSTFDLSAPFVQGWGMISTEHFWTGIGQMVKYFNDEEHYRDLNAYIISHPDYQLAKRGKLGLTELGDRFTAREEAIQSNLVEKANQYLTDATGIPNLARGSNRAFVGYLNYVRFNRFTDLLKAARLGGEDVSLGSKAVSDIADVVNNFTGRTSLGQYEGAAPLLNALFFAPRKVGATIQMFNPVKYLNPAISPTARKAAVRQLFGSLIATGAMLGLARAMGASVDLDPRSTNFAKIDINGEKFDVTGGNAIYVRLLVRLARNQEVTSTDRIVDLGSRYGTPTRADLVVQFARGKLSPIAGVIADALYGKDPVGRPFSVTQEMQDKLIPMTMGGIIQFGLEDPKNTAAYLPVLSTILGVGLQNPLPALGNKRDMWGEPMSKATPANDPVNQALKRVGFQPSPTEKMIRGIKLTDEQYDEYQQYAGRLAKTQLSKIIGNPRFAAMPVGAQEEVLRKNYNAAREQARTRMMMKYPQIVRDAQKAKKAAQTLGTPAAIQRRAEQ